MQNIKVQKYYREMFQINLATLLYLQNIDDKASEAIFVQSQIIEEEFRSVDSENKKNHQYWLIQIDKKHRSNNPDRGVASFLFEVLLDHLR